MAKLGTFCGECCFYDADKRNCTQGFIAQFKDRGATITWDSGSPCIDRVCMYRRDLDWNADLSLVDKERKSQEEAALKGSIILLADDLKNLENTAANLSALVGDRFTFIISHNCKLSQVLNITENLDIQASIVKSVDANASQEQRVFDALKNIKNGYLFIFDCNKEIDYSVFEKVHRFKNKLMYRLLHIEGVNETVHQSVSMSHLYKWLNGDLMEPFGNKLRNISREESSDCQVFSWEEVNEKCTDHI